MTSRVRLFPVAGLILLLGAALFLGRPATSAVLYTGFAQADSGPLSLEVTVNPPVGQPGDRLQMQVRIANRDNQSLSPSIVLKLPRSLTADVFALPSGATFNLQENRIDWLPIVPAGDAIEFALPVTVQSIDVLNPDQVVAALLRHQGASAEASAPLWLGISPLVDNVLTQDRVAVGQPVRLQADVTGPGPIKTLWDLGDGRRLEVAEPEVVYPAAGQYEITLEASNPGGSTTRQVYLTVLPAPVAAFSPVDDTLEIGQPAGFINTSGGQPPLQVYWDFGDGATLVGEQNPTHLYAHSGVYRVRLTIENDFGRSEAVWDITVGVKPVADVIIPDQATVGLPLTGQALGDDTVRQFVWDMGDGRRYEGETVSHIYRLPGDYYVSLAADNGHGVTQVGRWVRVAPGTSTLFLPMAAFQAADQPVATSADAPALSDLDPAVRSLSEVFRLDPISFPANASGVEQLYAYINAARARFSLPALPYNTELSLAAQAHARDKSYFPDNPHAGSDGTTGAERLLRSGYRGGYAGEATAWGFADPRLAVEFWINSDSHRSLLLNRLGSEVGIGYVEDYATANVWHWTAEFGIGYGASVQAVLRVQMPAAAHSALDTEITNYSWMWPLPLAVGEHFTVYLTAGERLIPMGTIAEPLYGSRYILSADARSILGSSLLGPGPTEYTWLVRLEDGAGRIIAESDQRSIAFSPDPEAPIIAATPTVVIVTATPNVPTPTASPTMPPTTEPPPAETTPIIVTATPQPTPTPEATP
jgi:PKD repeat protein